MKNILYYNPEVPDDKLFNPKGAYTTLDSTLYLKKRFQELGYMVGGPDKVCLKDCLWGIFLDYDSIFHRRPWQIKEKVLWTVRKLLNKWQYTSVYQSWTDSNQNERALWVIWEDAAVKSLNSSPEIHKLFKHILTWNDDLVDNKKYFKFYLPYHHKNPLTIIPKVKFKDKKLLINITMNKCSSAPGELYSERKKSIDYFDKYYSKDFDLYGLRWNIPENFFEFFFPFLIRKYKTYRGIIKHGGKLEVMTNYKFALCYENFSNGNGYVTEKIFDCFEAGTVPIYWGAPNIDKYVDPKAYIDRRNFQSNVELAKFITNMSEEKYQLYIEAAKKYLKSSKYKLFYPENFAQTIIKVLKLK